MRARALLVLLVAVGAGCAARGLPGDGSSISVGNINAGILRRGRPLLGKGEGYVMPPLWDARGNRYGTDEMVLAIQRAARRVRREYPGGTLGVGDLSPRGGGESQFHRSHENGRDADLIFYAVDERDRPATPVSAMPRYNVADLRAYAPNPTPGVNFSSFSPRRFDVRRNWALVRALLQDPYAEIQYLFCHEALKQRLLDHARAIGEDLDLVERAQEILHQPGDSLPHDDHLHVRLFCASDDRAYGCLDRGPVRWWKKRYKYMPPAQSVDFADAFTRMFVPPFPSGIRLIP